MARTMALTSGGSPTNRIDPGREKTLAQAHGDVQPDLLSDARRNGYMTLLSRFGGWSSGFVLLEPHAARICPGLLSSKVTESE